MKKIIPVVIVLLALGACSDYPKADKLIYNAKIYTLDSAFHTVEAMAVKDGKVLDTGSSHYIRSTYRAPEDIDLEGKIIYPGFNDGHTHFYWYAIGLDQLNLVGTKSLDEVIEKLKIYATERELDFIEGRGWDQNDWGMTDFPSNEKLNEAFPETPVLLTRIDGHAALVNDAAMRYSRVSPDTSVEGGLLMHKNGKFTGILVDNAVDLISVPAPTEEQGRAALLRAQDSLLSYGITSVTDAGLTDKEISLLQKMYADSSLRIRTNVMVSDKPELLDKYLGEDIITGEFLTVRSFKFYLDGALGSRGALLLEPYADAPENYGLMLQGREHFLEAAKRLDSAGWQMAIHAIGDSANRLALGVYEEVLGDSANDKRWRIEHAQVVDMADVHLYEKCKIIPSVQPTHATSDMYWAEDRLGKNRLKTAYAYKRLLQHSEMVVLGTDFPVESIDPRRTFAAAVFRQDTTGFPQGGFLPNQKLSRQNALRGMTHWPAFASFQEDFKGRLLPGMAADFLVSDDDLMKTNLAQTFDFKVLMTFLDGEMMYQDALKTEN